MKIFYSEGKPDYSSYTFSYGIYCLKEHQTELPEIYDRGFLPYSADPAFDGELFYLARSLRLDVDRFVDSSENRRTQRKIADLNINMSCQEKGIILTQDQAFLRFARAYASKRIGDQMSPARLDYILGLDTGTHIFAFRQNGEPVGYVLAAIEGTMLHYWFSFFDVALMRSHSLGKWMMWKVMTWAKEEGLHQVYLGTCYGSKSLYKVRDHKGLSFFDGHRWNPNMGTLKMWCKKDEDAPLADRLKQAESKNAYIDSLS